VETLPGHREVIHDVSWAPNMGRSYHLIATASKDKYVRIFKLNEDPFKYELVAEFEDHNAEVCVWTLAFLVRHMVITRLPEIDRFGRWSGISQVPSWPHQEMTGRSGSGKVRGNLLPLDRALSQFLAFFFFC